MSINGIQSIGSEAFFPIAAALVIGGLGTWCIINRSKISQVYRASQYHLPLIYQDARVLYREFKREMADIYRDYQCARRVLYFKAHAANGLNERDSQGRTFLHILHSCLEKKGHNFGVSRYYLFDTNMFKKLVNADTDVNVQDNFGRTPLHTVYDLPDQHYWKDRGFNENRNVMTKCLLNAGADPTIPDKRGNTPLHYAVRYFHFGLINRLMENATPQMLRVQNKIGDTPLHTYIRALSIEEPHTYLMSPFMIFTEFLKDKSLLDITNCENLTPLMLAALTNRFAKNALLGDLSSTQSRRLTHGELVNFAQLGKSETNCFRPLPANVEIAL